MQALDLQPKKWPRQARSRETFEAIVEAAAWLLARRGYAGTTTNHVAERAGVNVSSLYEYFPNKDAIVAQVAERLVDRVMARLASGAARMAEVGEDEALARWVDVIYETVKSERDLVAVFLYQVPYTNRLEPMRAAGARLVEFSNELRHHAGPFVSSDFSPATTHLVVNLVSSTILQLLLDPPDDVGERELLDELTARLEAWIRV